ncbi:MAG: SusC/RagA family TonB-linked outer membrane protein [Bacteroidia bacterium]
MANPVMAQNRTITGKVTSADDKESLVGVTVSVKGTTIATSTDVNGGYSISVPASSSILTFSYVGMKKTEVAIGTNTTIDVALLNDGKGLDEVVVTAIALEKSAKSLGYSTQSVSGKEVSESGEQNVIQGLASKAAGVYVQGSSGTPGASSKILLRGNTTFEGSNQPLIVIDGLPISNETENTVASDYPFNANLQGVQNSNRGLDINPDDIETITVLKGPAAAALYGAQAASGAIIITTKKARVRGKGKGFNVTYSTSLELQKVNKLPELQTKYGQGTGGGTIVAGAPKEAGAPNPASPNSWGPLTKPDSAWNNMEEFFKTGHVYNNSVVLNAFNEKSSLRLSLANLKQDGVIPNTDFKRNTITVNADHRISDKFIFGTTFSYVNSGGTLVQNGSNLAGVMLGLTRTPANFRLDDPKSTGDNGWTNKDGSQRSWFPLYDNPHWSVRNNPFTTDMNRVYGNMNFRASPFSFMDLTYRLGTDVYTDKRYSIFSIGSNQPASAPNGEINENIITYRYVYQDILATFKRSLTKDIDASLMLGSNLQYEKTEDQYLRGRDLTVPDYYNLSNASNLYANSSYSILKKSGIFADLNMNYKEYLFLNATVRQDRWSSFNKTITYPSTSLAFVFSDFVKQKWFTFGKVRVAYAQAGKGPSPYATRNYYGKPFFTDGFTDGLGFPYLGQNGFGISNTLNDPNIKPETTSSTEIGLDLRFFESRLKIDFSYYNQQSKNIILSLPIAPSSGFRALYTNSGQMENKGIEIFASGTAIKKKNFSWDIGLNFSRNRNKVIALANGVEELAPEQAFNSAQAYAIVGSPYGAIYGTKWKRNDAGQLIIGTNGLPMLESEKANLGNPYPDWMMGLRNSFNYKGIKLTGLLDIRQGGVTWNGTYARLNRLGRTEESTDRNRTYLIEGVLADGSANTKEISANAYWSTYQGDGGAYATENAIQDVSWMRLRELGLSYNLKLKAIDKYVKSIDLGFVGKNLWLKTDYKGVDPETSLTGAGSNIGGFDYFNNPGIKSYIFSLKANF